MKKVTISINLAVKMSLFEALAALFGRKVPLLLSIEMQSGSVLNCVKLTKATPRQDTPDLRANGWTPTAFFRRACIFAPGNTANPKPYNHART